MTPALSVIIVNFNAGDHLERCLSSLAEHLPGMEWEGLVIDNASTDQSDRAVARFGPRVALVRNTENIGFGRAVNQGMAATRAPVVLLLNPDARLLKGAVEGLQDVLRSHSDCAVVGPTVVDEDGGIQGSARGDPNMLTGLFGRSTLLTRLFPGAAVTRRNVVNARESRRSEDSVEVNWVSGACMLVGRTAFEQVGGFDPQYFLYWEDADFCRRLRAVGYRTRYRPDARVVHTVGRSSRTAQRLAIRAFHQSAYLYYSTHVARSAWHPARWIAFLLLRARGWWKTRTAPPSSS
ncbi:MAG: glycosyltransferase family 2 protein [Acidobacteria bacterium]|nr:glycosyltransferase family 2 protein [Acidobacteriota bacterium]